MSAPRGEHWWHGTAHIGAGAAFTGIAAADAAPLPAIYRDASPAQVADAVAAAVGASEACAALPGSHRARFLRAVAEAILAQGDALLERAHQETALPLARLQAERGRTLQQLELFAALAQEGSWVDARIDRADPTSQPLPRPDLRAMLVPLGPVAVFGASNFPFAYSVAGGDTASAWAAGCPVVVKAHPAHPGTSELVARAIVQAAAASNVPAGVFGMVHGQDHAVGAHLVRAPGIAAVGFTGSYAGGQALCGLAAARPVPIPVFAEMGSANPVFVLPEALAARGGAIAERLAASALQAAGQFCTSPGIVLFGPGPAAAAFVASLRRVFAAAAVGPLVHPTIRAHFERAVAAVRALPGVAVEAVASAAPACAATGVPPMLLLADAAAVLAQVRLREEIYGPALLAVRCTDSAEMVAVARAFAGHLTATVHATAADLAASAELLTVLRGKVGRLIHDGVPTGVLVTTAMQHGGPWPASSDSRFTAVGPRAILRWARPLCFQDAPPAVLPPELRDDNPCGLLRTVGGVLGRH